ncbi:thiamine diphosphokinase [Streptococcus tangpeifui]|uniref:thiamine diphosphokinase n=1 Tax=Streptococcus tangpeifui TaxID=2709400 RepID=UPI0013ECE284|nr:thiamine diphosphokinase [Streptococcus sp. ZJ1593]
MPKKVALLAGGSKVQLPENFDLYVGIDRGCLWILEQGLPLDVAIGDFDSVTARELALIRQHVGKIIQAPSEKNDTDTELAVKTVLSQYPQAVLTIYGAFGGRLDHTLSNVFLPSDPEIAPFMQSISLLDDQNTVSYLPAGQHQILPDSAMTYVSFMPSQEAKLTIEGAKYELTSENYFKKQIYSSNEFTNQAIEVSLDKGYLIVIQSKDKL